MNRKAWGTVNFNTVMIALVALVAGLSIIAIMQSVTFKNRVATAFEGWAEDHAGYQQVIETQQRTKSAVIVYFYASWCPHCKNFTSNLLSHPKVKEHLKKYPRVRIAPDNGQIERELMTQYGATGYPTFYVVPPGKSPVKVEPYSSTQPGQFKTPAEFNAAVDTAAGNGA